MTRSPWLVLAASIASLQAIDVRASQEAPDAPLANLCLSGEYIYAGSRLLAVVKGPLPTVALASTWSTPNEAGGNAAVGVVLTTPGDCPIDGNVVVQYSTGSGTATAGVDYTAVPSGSLTIPANTPSGTTVNINVALTNDALDEDPETFTVNLVSVTAATLSGPPTHLVTIEDDDPLPFLSIGDATGDEPVSITMLLSHNVTLSPVSGRDVKVNYTTGGGTATAQSGGIFGDYGPVSGTLTFPAGQTTLPPNQRPNVPVYPDDIDEPTEFYLINLAAPPSPEPFNAQLLDGQGQGTIIDTDDTPSVSVSDSVRDEGDEGTNRMDFIVSLSHPSAFTLTVNYATADGTAVSPRDYLATSGQVTFNAGDTTEQPRVDIVTDGLPEPNEQFVVNLTLPAGAQNVTLGDAQAAGIILNDDPQFVSSVELTPGVGLMRDLRPVAGAPAAHWYRVGQKPRSSYEVVVDGTSGDVGLDYGIELQRLEWDQSTVIQHSLAVTPDGQGRGHSKSLRWRNYEHFSVNGEFVRVRSAQCGTDCGPDDVYRVRLLDTTYAVPRFNNSQTQVTVLVVHNTSASQVAGTCDFWDASGAYLSSDHFVLDPKASVVLNTSLTVPGLSGSITVLSTAGYGELSGKAVAIEPTTGFSFDTPMVPRPR